MRITRLQEKVRKGGRGRKTADSNRRKKMRGKICENLRALFFLLVTPAAALLQSIAPAAALLEFIVPEESLSRALIEERALIAPNRV